MIEDQIVTLKGKRYAWTCEVCEGAERPYSWADEASNEEAPVAIRHRLNRLFIQERSADVAADLEDNAERSHFCKVLREMGASDEEIAAARLSETLYSLFPERTPSNFAQHMPLSAHGPLNCQTLRDWFLPPLTEKQWFEIIAPDGIFNTAGILNTGPVRLIGNGPFGSKELDDDPSNGLA